MSDLIKHQRRLLGMASNWAQQHLPGWDDACHRDLLTNHGAKVQNGKTSALTLNGRQLEQVLGAYEARGWPRQRQLFRGNKVSPQIAHMVRLWARLGQAGRVTKASRPALLAYCSRQLGGQQVANLDALGTAQRTKIIESLKGWLNR